MAIIINNADALMELSTRHLLDNWPVVETVRATQNYEGDHSG